MQILFVEDNDDFREEIGFQLSHLGYQVIAMDRGQALLDWLDTHPLPPLLLLDLGLPDIDGLELCRRIRQDYPSIAIIMLTARGEIDQRVAGWEAGAHAYLTKPVHLRELQAVLLNLQQHLGLIEPPVADRWRLQVQAGRLISPAGQTGEVTFIESQLLQAFAKQKGQPVARHDLVQALGEQPWEYDMRRLETSISRLRKKLVELGGDKRLIHSVRGKGYQFKGGIDCA